ncbi:Subtilisin-like protease SBT1.4, partial [Linum perenne]
HRPVCRIRAEACNRKLIGARTFYKGYKSYRGRPIDESKSPKDTEGHETHTASTAGGSIVRNASLFHYADGEARGVATKAWIAAYKICWLAGCFNSDILAAMDQAIIKANRNIGVWKGRWSGGLKRASDGRRRRGMACGIWRGGR